MSKLVDLTGQRFGRLVVIERGASIERSKFGTLTVWKCRCDCGNVATVRGICLRRGLTRSCGCLRADLGRAQLTTHGCGTRGKRTPEYQVWASMKNRCLNPNDHAFKNYGGRGIVVCERWKKFENFLADMGQRPNPEYSLDRVDNDGPYSPENCRWATRDEQAKNRHREVALTLKRKVFDLEQVIVALRSQVVNLQHAVLELKAQRLGLQSIDELRSIQAKLKELSTN